MGLDKALSSERFASLIDALFKSDAKELGYMKLNTFLTKTTNLLGLPSDDIAVGYAGKAKDAVERINKPLIGSVYQGIASADVEDYMTSLATLPTVRRDKDYLNTVSSLIRASKTHNHIRDELPGYESAWGEFWEQNLKPVFTGLPNVIADPDRRRLFEALAAVVSGDVPPGLEEYEDAILETHEAFARGDTQTLSDGLYGITAHMVRTPPPAPPGGRGDPDSDEEDSGTGQGPSSGTGGSGGSPSKNSTPPSSSEDEDQSDPPEDDEQESEEPDEDDSGGDADDPAGSEDDDSEEESGEEEDEDEDPFSKLGEYQKSVDESERNTPEEIGTESLFANPELPDDIDMEASAALEATGADVGLPTITDGTAWLYLETPTPPGGPEVFRRYLSTYASEYKSVQRIINEVYRTSMYVERGLTSGRVDQARLYNVAFNKTDVFRRDFIGSMGSLDLVLLLDESGSMTAVDEVTGYKTFDAPPAHTTLSHEELYFGRGLTETNRATRFNNAKLLATLLLQASRDLDGFNVEVIGYGEDNPDSVGPLKGVAEAVIKLREERNTDNRYYYGVPVVRKLGDKQNPYPITTTYGMSGNADAEGLAYAVEKLSKSTHSQRAIMYLADGHVYDGETIIEDLLKKAKRHGIYVYFMNLSGSPYEEGALAQIDNHLVNSPKEMLVGLQKFLHNVVQRAV